MKLEQGFAEGKRMMPGPGIETVLNVVRGFSLVQNKEHDPEGSLYRPRKRGSLIMRQA